MRLDLKIALFALFWFIVGGVCGLFIGKGIYDRPIEEKVERDTVVAFDTIPQYFPKPVKVERLKYVTRFMPVVRTDTIYHFANASNMMHDTVAVEVPITSKHYQSPEYDAWVSGFEPSLDSIKVYQRTEYITERVTLSKPPNKWELDAVAGLDYNIMSKHFTPYAGGELLYKPNRLQVGIRGGVAKKEKAEPFAGAVVKIRLF